MSADKVVDVVGPLLINTRQGTIRTRCYVAKMIPSYYFRHSLLLISK